MNVHRCSTCQQPLPSSHPLVAGKVNRPATVNRRSPDAATNELATEIRAAEDVIDPHAAPLVVLGQGDSQVRIDLPKPDYSGMQGFFRKLGRAMGYRTEGGASHV